MFTGIVTDIGDVLAIEPRAEGLSRIKIDCRYDPEEIDVGASIACSGVCLTAVGAACTGTAVDAAAETLRVTTVETWFVGNQIQSVIRQQRLGNVQRLGQPRSGVADLLATALPQAVDAQSPDCGRQPSLHRANFARVRSVPLEIRFLNDIVDIVHGAQQPISKAA
jgi:Lumazine binding domain